VSPRILAAAGAVLALLAAFAGSPFAAQHGRVDVNELARAVVREDDHVTAIELAQWIKDRRAGLRVVDVRPRADFELYHIPTAEPITLDSLASTRFRADETIVLYSEGAGHAAQGWVFLRALGYRKVYFLREGLYEWLDQVMNPTLAPGQPDGARRTFERVAALSRYFGGVPREGEPPATDDVIAVPRSGARASADRSSQGQVTAGQQAALRVRRRGC
jgi:rhodanese-related sulfurtransferase